MMRVQDDTRQPRLMTVFVGGFIGLGLGHIIRHLCIAIAEGRLPGL